MYKVLGILICWLFVTSNYEYAKASEFGPFQGKIVDADTKEPIEGVVVFIEWRKLHAFAGSTLIDAQETLTDRNGDFFIPGIWILNPWTRSTSDALMIVYKSGYQAITTGAWKDWKVFQPTLEYVLKVEDGKPTIVLRKLVDIDRRWENVGHANPGSKVPDEKKKLIMMEINKEKEIIRKIKP